MFSGQDGDIAKKSAIAVICILSLGNKPFGRGHEGT